jgi:hypothetical protein
MGLYSRIAGLLSGPVQWISSVVAPGFSQAAAVSGAGANMTLAPQAATTTGASGSVIANVAAPASGTVEAGLQFVRGGAKLCTLQGYIGSPTAAWAIYSGGVSPTALNYTIEGALDGSTMGMNATTGVYLGINGVGVSVFTSTGMTLVGALSGVSGSPFKLGNSAVTLATSGTTSLSAAQQGTPNLTLAAVTLTGAAVLDFGNVTGNFQVNILGVNAASFATFGLSFKNGTTTTALPSTALSNGGLVIVRCDPNLLAFCA